MIHKPTFKYMFMSHYATEVCKCPELSLFFRIQTGKNFLKWRKERRIEEAKKLLLEDRDIPTLIIGEAVGICDKSNFRRQFKEITGFTPAEWRLKH